MVGLSPNHLQGVHINDFPIVEDLLYFSIVLYDIDTVARNIIGEFAGGIVKKYENTGRLPRYNNHMCYDNKINAVFHSFCCPTFDTFFNRTFKLERLLNTCSERLQNAYLKNVYQTQETPFDKLDSF